MPADGGFLSAALALARAIGGRVAKRLRDRRPLEAWAERNPNRGVWQLALDKPLPAFPVAEGVRYVPPAEVEAWLRRLGAVDYHRTIARLFLRGRGDHEVHVRNVRVRILDRHAPILETWVWSPSAGDEEATLLLYNLDEDEPQAWEGKLLGARETIGAEPYFNIHTVFLRNDEAKEFRVEATTATSLVRWQIEIDYRISGREDTLIVAAPDGGWFQTSGGEIAEFKNQWLTGVASLQPGEPIRRARHDADGNLY